MSQLRLKPTASNWLFATRLDLQPPLLAGAAQIPAAPPARRVCVYDRDPILTASATAARGPHGETIGARRRAETIIEHLAEKYGPWHAERRIAEALQTGYRLALAEAIIAMPVVRPAPLPACAMQRFTGTRPSPLAMTVVLA